MTHEIDEAIELADRIVVLSKKPTRVLETVTVGAGRPRDLHSPEIETVRARLKSLLGVNDEAE